MSEPLTRESEAWRKLTAIGVPNSASLKPKIAELIATLLAQLETLEKQRAADLEAQQAAMLKCIREERVSKQAERDALRAQLEWCESERNAARARCEQQSDQLEQHARLLLEKTAHCEQLEAALNSLKILTSGSTGCVWVEGTLPGRFGKIDLLENSTIASESPAKEPA